MTNHIDHRLFPTIYTDGRSYFTVSDGQAWRWVYVSGGLFGDPPREAHWYARRDAIPARWRYSYDAPVALQEAVRRKSGELHRYDLHEGQKHLSEELAE